MQIDLSALENNFLAIRSRTGSGRKLCAVVKANAYGHGAVIVAKRLQHLGCDYFGVALVEEGIELRRAGIESPIVMIGALNGEESVRAAALHDIEFAIHSKEVLPAVARVAAELGRPLRAHLKIETGMGRLGLMPQDVPGWCEQASSAGVNIVGVYTTFTSSDVAGSERTPRQLQRFLDAVEAVRRGGFDPKLLHAANSGAILNYPETLLTMVRPGLLLFGIPPAPGALEPPFKAVASLRSRVVQVGNFPAGYRFGYSGSFTARRPSRIAVLPIGYADGLNRLLSNNGEVLVNGRRAAIVGRVSMDLVLEEISVWEIAERVGSIPWEVLCRIGDRVPRVATDGDDIAEVRTRFT